jgi:hypothetical protein
MEGTLPHLHAYNVICVLKVTIVADSVSGPSGEIGRHSGLKIRRLPEKGRTGSIPVSGTKLL